MPAYKQLLGGWGWRWKEANVTCTRRVWGNVWRY